MTIVWTIFKLGMIRLDHAKLHQIWKEELVTKTALLSEEEYQFIQAKAKLTFGSLKISYAFFTGQVLRSAMFGSLLVFVMVVPSLLLYTGLYYVLAQLVPPVQMERLSIGACAVLAAYFVSEAWTSLQAARRTFALLPTILILLVTGMMLIILRIPSSIVLLVMLVFLICIMKGGPKHD